MAKITGICPGCQNPGALIVEGHYVPHILFLAEPDPETGYMTVLCEGSELPMRECRVCGCTEEDCTGCVVKTGQPCFWVEDDLCSACWISANNDRSLANARAHDTIVSIHQVPGDCDGRIQLKRVGGFRESPDLGDQLCGNAFLHGLADATGDAELKELAEQGGVAWVTDMRREGLSNETITIREFSRETLSVPAPEDGDEDRRRR